jgi:hypothetical protein
MRRIVIKTAVLASIPEETAFYSDMKNRAKKMGLKINEDANRKNLWIFFPVQTTQAGEVKPFVVVDAEGEHFTLGCNQGKTPLFKETYDRFNQVAKEIRDMYNVLSLRGANALAKLFSGEQIIAADGLAPVVEPKKKKSNTTDKKRLKKK